MDGTISPDEIKRGFDEYRRAAEEFKATLKSVSDRVDALDKVKLDKLNESLATFEQKHTAAMAQEAAKREALEALVNRVALGAGHAPDEGKARAEAEYKAFARCMRVGEERLSADERKVLSVSNDTTGGYLAPATFVAQIIKAVVEISPMRSLVSVMQIGSGSELQIPKRTTAAAATRYGEAATRSETTNPAWGMLRITAPELYAEARVTNANLEDSAFNLEQILAQEFAEQFAYKEGYEVINGAGVEACLGFLDANAAGPSTPISSTVSGSAATIAGASGAEAAGLITLFHAVKTEYAKNGTWVMNRASLGKVRGLKDTSGQLLWQPSLQVGAPTTLLGAPVVEAADMPSEGANTYPIAFGDWKRAYVLAEKVGMSMTRDPYSIANVGQVKFFARRRVGGQVVLGEALRLLKCST